MIDAKIEACIHIRRGDCFKCQLPSLLRMWSPFISLSLNLSNSLDHNGETLKANNDIFKVLKKFFFLEKMSEKKTKTGTYLWPNKDKDIFMAIFTRKLRVAN